MITLFKLGFEVLEFGGVLVVGIAIGAKVEQKWPGAISKFITFGKAAVKAV